MYHKFSLLLIGVILCLSKTVISATVVQGLNESTIVRGDLKITEIKRCAGRGIEGGPGGTFFTVGRINANLSAPEVQPNCISKIGEKGEEIWKLDLPPKYYIRNPEMIFIKQANTVYVYFVEDSVWVGQPPGSSYEQVSWLWAINATTGQKRWEKVLKKCSSASPCDLTPIEQRGSNSRIFSADSKGVFFGQAMGFWFAGDATDPWERQIGVSIDMVGFNHSGDLKFEVSDQIDFLTEINPALGLSLGLQHLEVDWQKSTITLIGSRLRRFRTSVKAEVFIDHLTFQGKRLWRYRPSDFPYPSSLPTAQFVRKDSFGFLMQRQGVYFGLIVGRDGKQKALHSDIISIPSSDEFPQFFNGPASLRVIEFADGDYGIPFGFGFNLFSINLKGDLTGIQSKTKTEVYKPGDENQLHPDFRIVPAENDTFYVFSPDIGSQSADDEPKTFFYERFTVSGKDLVLKKRETVVNTEPSKWISWAENTFHFVAKTENTDVIQHGLYLAGPN
ncbi:MAG: hypothetical protein EBQ92_08905 [Proteobacteria bacterium]|nr:hypothetical protein [Pseudomonadota bacterium]